MNNDRHAYYIAQHNKLFDKFYDREMLQVLLTIGLKYIYIMSVHACMTNDSIMSLLLIELNVI